MTTTTTATASASSNLYPFLTKRQLKDRIASDVDFATHCLLVMYNRQTTDEQEQKDTKYRNKRGFMSSHAVRGTELALKVLSGEWLNPDETLLMQGIVGSYTKQLASHFRQEALEANPALTETAKVFGV